MLIYDPELAEAAAAAAQLRASPRAAVAIDAVVQNRRAAVKIGAEAICLWVPSTRIGEALEALNQMGNQLGELDLTFPSALSERPEFSGGSLDLLRIDDALAPTPTFGFRLGLGAATHLSDAGAAGVKGALSRLGALGRTLRDVGRGDEPGAAIYVDQEVFRPAGALLDALEGQVRWVAAARASELVAALSRGEAPTRGILRGQSAAPLRLRELSSATMDGRALRVERLSTLFVRALPPISIRRDEEL